MLKLLIKAFNVFCSNTLYQCKKCKRIFTDKTVKIESRTIEVGIKDFEGPEFEYETTITEFCPYCNSKRLKLI